MDTGSRIKLVREHRGLTQQKLGEMLGYGKSSANRIAQYEMGYRSPKANRLKEIAKAMNIREEIFLMPDETPIDLLRILIWYDWEHEGVLQLATSRTANTPPGKTVSPIIYSEQLPLNRLLLDWADQKHSLSVRKITRADYLEWMLQWPPRLPLKDPMQHELFYETVGCVGSFIVCNLLLRWAFIVLSELDRNGTQKNKSAKNNNIIS